MRQTILYLVRHGQTIWNAENRFQGTSESPLNEIGVEEAKKLADEFSSLTVGAIYTSPLQRARHTAEIIGNHHACEIFCEHDLREGTWGPLEGIKRDDFFERFKHDFERINNLPKEERFKHKHIPEAESSHEVALRALPCLHKIAKAHLGQIIIVVSHGWVIKTVLCLLTDFDDRKIAIANTGFLQLKGDGEMLSVAQYRGIIVK